MIAETMSHPTVEANSRAGIINDARSEKVVGRQAENLDLASALSDNKSTTAACRRRSSSRHAPNYRIFNSFNVCSSLTVIVIQLAFLTVYCRAHLFGHGWFSSSPALFTGRSERRSTLSTAATVPSSNCTKTYTAVQGETCASLRTSQGLSQSQIFELNPELNCKTLTKGQAICVQGISFHCGRTISVTKGPTNMTCASIEQAGNLTSEGLFILNPGLSCPEAQGNNNSWPSSHLVCTFPGVGSIFFQYMGASGMPITFTDVSPLVQKFPVVIYHVILAFASDYDSNGKRTNGTYYPYWSDQLTPEAAKAFKAANPNAQILMSLGGASKFVNSNVTADVAWVDPVNTAEWLNNAQASLTAIASNYSIDGIDIDYETFPNGSASFSYCMGTLIQRLKGNNTIGLATIAPLGSVQSAYLTLMSTYGDFVDYVNFQFYASQLPTVQAYISQFDNTALQFPPWKLTASTQTYGNNTITGTSFLQAINQIARDRGLPGVMLYDADHSVADNFINENNILAVLNAGPSTSYTPVPAPALSPHLGPSPVPSLGPAPTPGGPALAPRSSLSPAPTPGGPASAPRSSLSPAPTPGGPAPAPRSSLSPAPTPGGPTPAPRSSLSPAPTPGGPTPAPRSSLAPAPSPGAPGGAQKSSLAPAPAPRSSLAPAPTPRAPKSSPAPGPGSTLAPGSPSTPGSQAPGSTSAEGPSGSQGPPGPPPNSAPGCLQTSRWFSQGLGLVGATVLVLLLSL